MDTLSFRHNKSSSLCHYIETPEMGASILSDGVGKPFSVRPAADDFPIFLHLILFPEKFFVKQWHINLSLNG